MAIRSHTSTEHFIVGYFENMSCVVIFPSKISWRLNGNVLFVRSCVICNILGIMMNMHACMIFCYCLIPVCWGERFCLRKFKCRSWEALSSHGGLTNAGDIGIALQACFAFISTSEHEIETVFPVPRFWPSGLRRYAMRSRRASTRYPYGNKRDMSNVYISYIATKVLTYMTCTSLKELPLPNNVLFTSLIPVHHLCYPVINFALAFPVRFWLSSPAWMCMRLKITRYIKGHGQSQFLFLFWCYPCPCSNNCSRVSAALVHPE